MGGFDIEVGGHTGLTGAVIASEAEAEKNSLTTATLSTEDIQNKSSYSAETKGWGVEISGDKGSISPSLPMEEDGKDHSTTKSAIAPGTVTITDEAAQQARTGQDAATTIANLNRDTGNAHQGPLAHNPDLQDLLDKQAELADAAAQAGQAVAKTVGDIAKNFTKDYEKIKSVEEDAWRILNDPNASEADKAAARQTLQGVEQYLAENPQIVSDYENWKDGGIFKTTLQAAGAALVAQLGNGEGLNAALGAAASQLAAGKVNELTKDIASHITDDPDKAALIANIFANVISNGIGQAVGGASGSNAASTMDRYNRQMHPDEKAWILANAQRYADERGISLEQAKAELTQQALRMIDKWWAGILPAGDNEAAKAFLEQAASLSFADRYVSEVFYFQAAGKLYENSGHLAEYLSDDSYFNFIKTYGTSGITGDINAVAPYGTAHLIDFKWLWKDPQNASALDSLSPEERNKVLSLLEVYATTMDVGMENYALLGYIYNQGPLDGGLREGVNESDELAKRLNAIYGSNKAASIIYNDFSGKMNAGVANYFISAATLAVLAKNVGAKDAAKASEVKYSPINPGPLPPSAANSFRSGTYVEKVTSEPTVLYRVYGGKAGELGSYWTRTPPSGPLQSIIDSALDPQWGNTASKVVQIKIPAGVKIYEGVAASQRGLVGGGNQIVLSPGFQVDPSWVLK